MTQLEKMKKQIILQIEKLDINDFEELNDLLSEQPYFPNKSMFFTCKDCRKKYGNCSEEDRLTECSERFKKYILSEVHE